MFSQIFVIIYFFSRPFQEVLKGFFFSTNFSKQYNIIFEISQQV